MKLFFFILTLFLITNCTQNKGVYWCGDHACINKAEKEAYFKKTMIVERRLINKKDLKKTSDFEKISKQVRAEQKKIKKDKKLKAKYEKNLQKETKLKEKLKKKAESDLKKQIKLDEKLINKNKIVEKNVQNELDKKIAKDKKKVSQNTKKTSSKFVSTLCPNKNEKCEPSKFELVAENIKKKKYD